MSGAFPLLTPNLNTGGPLGTESRPVIAHQVILHDQAAKSFVTLPIVDQPRRIPMPGRYRAHPDELR